MNSAPLWAGVISGVIKQVADTVALYNGQIDKHEYAVSTLTNISSSLGIIAGIEYGAAVGTMVFPGVGTAVGSIMGGILGDVAGRHLGQTTGGLFYNRQNINVSGDNVTVMNEIHCDPRDESHAFK